MASGGLTNWRVVVVRGVRRDRAGESAVGRRGAPAAAPPHSSAAAVAAPPTPALRPPGPSSNTTHISQLIANPPDRIVLAIQQTFQNNTPAKHPHIFRLLRLHQLSQSYFGRGNRI